MSTFVDGRVIGYTPMEQFAGTDGQPVYKLNMVLETLGTYPKKVYIQIMGTDKINSLQAITHLPIVRVHVNLSGREYTKDGKTTYFKEIDGWKVEAVPAAAVQGAPVAAAPAPAMAAPVNTPTITTQPVNSQPVWNGTAWVLPASAPIPAYAAPQPAWNPQQNPQPPAPLPVQSIPAPHAAPAFNPLTPQQGNMFNPNAADLPF